MATTRTVLVLALLCGFIDSGCKTTPPADYQYITSGSGSGSHNTISGLNSTGGLQNGPDCLVLRYNVGTIDQLCWTKSSTWDANSNHWRGEPPWDMTFVSDTNFPRQGSAENSIGRMSCIENNDNRTDLHRIWPSPGTLNQLAN